MSKLKNEVIAMSNKVQVGETVEFMGRTITRTMPGLWMVNGIECVGINDLLHAFNCW